MSTVRQSLWFGTAAMLIATACGEDTPDPMGPGTLEAPTNLSATVVSDTEIDLSWTAVTGATGYLVERQPVGGAFSQVGTPTDAQFSDTGLTPGAVYTYRVSATAGTNTSAASGTVTEQTFAEARQDLVGNITTDLTLDADTVYVLKGVVQVQDGATLTIEPGTTILGDKVSQGTLLVLQGGILIADGTAQAPIVFTSSQAPGSRTKGDWGGVIINGRSNCNFPAGGCVGEGNTGVYGGSMPDDSSGVIRYVRIEFAGIEFSADNELNALTLNGVGSGTVIEYVQVHGGLDDGIELFGGTVDIKHAVATAIADDSFDWSTGWVGRMQFLIAQQDPGDDESDNGWEIDNNEGDFERLPRTFGQVYNFTLIGKPDTTGSASDVGIVFRRGYAGEHSCGIVMGFGKPGLDIDDAATERLASKDSLTLTQTTFWMNGQDENSFSGPIGVNFDPDTESDGTTTDFEAMWVDTTNGTKGITLEDPMLTDPFNLSSPDFSPMGGSPVIAGGCTPPNDGWFDTVAYRGAVADANDTWYQGWTAFPSN